MRPCKTASGRDKKKKKNCKPYLVNFRNQIWQQGKATKRREKVIWYRGNGGWGRVCVEECGRLDADTRAHTRAHMYAHDGWHRLPWMSWAVKASGPATVRMTVANSSGLMVPLPSRSKAAKRTLADSSGSASFDPRLCAIKWQNSDHQTTVGSEGQAVNFRQGTSGQHNPKPFPMTPSQNTRNHPPPPPPLPPFCLL